MATKYPTACPEILRGISRRSSRTWAYISLAILFLFLLHLIFPRRHVIIIGPGDLRSGSRDVRPEDDNSPFAHEPMGLGRLRDVREDKFYRGGTLTLDVGTSAMDSKGDQSHPSPVVFDPYPSYNEGEWRKDFPGSFCACEGPRGSILNRWKPEDAMTVYPSIQKGDRNLPLVEIVRNINRIPDFPPSLIGSYAALELEASICTNRYSRLSAYGYESNNVQGMFGVWQPPRLNWDRVHWGSLQSKCFTRNSDRYNQGATDRNTLHALPTSPPVPFQETRRSQPKSPPDGPRSKERSAVVVRIWHDMEWTENQKQHVRSLIMELSLHSGGEYEVFLLCHVRDSTISLTDQNEESILHLKVLFVPPEFVDMTILFNDHILQSWYPMVEDHSTVTQIWQPIQVLAEILQGFDHFWQLEMDARFTGHTYHFLEQAAKFSMAQPRRYLWERNAYFYIPGSHGTWQEFMKMVEVSMRGVKSIWGSLDTSTFIPSNKKPPIIPAGPKPPVTSPKDDKFEWGVGEEADLITFNPIFDPIRTAWPFAEAIWNLRKDVPRRASSVAMGRLSTRLLHEMHDMQAQWGASIASEMTAPTVALWHGFKAVYAPQPVYLDGKWTAKELGRVMNPGSPEAINGEEDSFWNWDHSWDHILYRCSYMFTSQTPEDFYRRWMGYKINPNQYTDGTFHQDPQGLNWFENGDLKEDLYGPLCFPPMLLHPVKNPEEKQGEGMAVPV
ncbi:hypothetical protein N7456_011598 [Penicillium angulare]|uniref:Uncharacterized protein n=1 Tax=Penicillium angulare TaxID=116970 RepID=A0A9W9ETZ0_9EURO|nr:hypothetical protein N7456_011598 [Penicillium angulare]